MLNTNLENSEFKYLQTSLKKYFSSNSIHLIDYFLIVGYEDICIQEKIIKEIQNKEISPSSNTKTNIYKAKDYPTVLSSISSDYEGEIIDDEDIIKNIFPSQEISVYYNKGDNMDINLNPKNIIFSQQKNNIITNYFAYVFYEGISLTNRTRIFIPKIFIILSQYNFYSTFNNICKEIHNLFYSNNIQIPIELQIYNIINYIPVPIGKRLDLTLFPFYELSNINKCQCNEEFISLDEQKIYSIERIKGYNEPELNIKELLEVINIELLVETYIKILLGYNVNIVYNDNEILSIIIFLFEQFLFPLNINEYNNKININNEEYYYYQFNKENNDIKYSLDINKKVLILKNEPNENFKKLDEYIKKIISECLKENTEAENDINKNENNLYDNIKELVMNIKKIKEKNNRYGNFKEKKYNFFEMLNEKETEENNHIILNSFYKFNLYIFEHFYQYYFKIDENNENSTNNNDSEDDKIFYKIFSNSVYSKIFNEQENNDASLKKIIFENILNYKKKFSNNEQLNNLDIFDLIYKPKESDKFEPLTFLEFYKYYFENLQTYFNDIISNDFVSCKKDKSDKVNFWYKYKKINLDKNILIKYNYLLEQMPIEDKNKCFPYLDTNTLSNLKSEIKVKDINNIFDLFLINNKEITSVDIIKYSILQIVVLSLSAHKLVFFTECIYDLIKDINISLNKYIEVILSIAYRVFTSEKNHNLFIYEKYFDIYKILIENNLIYANNNINIIYEKIKSFIESIQDKNKEIKENSDCKLVKESDSKKLYTLDPKLKDKDVLSIITNAAYNGNTKGNKINFKTKILKDKPISLNDVFSPIKLLNNLNKMVDEYYFNLDFSKINKDEYKKLIIQVIYYINLFPNDINKDIIKFLIYCLKIEKNKE